jgi:hypothetical protein
MIEHISNYYKVSVSRCGITMICQVSSEKKAKETERMMMEDAVVDLKVVRYCFNPDKIFIIRKPNITPFLGFKRGTKKIPNEESIPYPYVQYDE